MRRLLVVALGLTSIHCAESTFEEDVSAIARLSVLQVALLANELAEDKRCGFDTESVKDAVVISGEVLERGSVTYQVKGCELGFDAVERVLDNCGQDPIRLFGRAIVDGTMTIDGVITGDEDDPIIPAGPDAVTITLDRVVLDGFKADFSTAEGSLEMREGSLTAQISPRLARGKDAGYCAIPTGDAEVRHLVYDSVSLRAKNEKEALLFVRTSDLRGQIGRGLRGENFFAGEITIGGQRVELPTDGASNAIDDDYDREDFERGFTCKEDLHLPLDFECACVGNECHPDAPVADGIARLTPIVFANLVSLIEDDETCGFGADQTPSYEGAWGEEGTAIYSVAGCRLAFPTNHHRDTDCNGVATFVRGEAIVTGEKRVHGFLTGDVDGDAVVPTSGNAVTYSLRVELADFHVTTSSDTPTMLIRSGTIDGTMLPALALDAESGACSLPTSFATFERLDLENADVRLFYDSNGHPRERDFAVERSSVSATLGRVGDRENELSGTVVASGERFEVPSDQRGLDPDNRYQTLEDSFTCEANLIWPVADTQCSFRKELAPDVARAVVQQLAIVAGRAVVDDGCGFSSNAATVTSDAMVGEIGTVTKTMTACVLEEDDTIAVADDCHRRQTHAEGTATVSGTRRSTGRITHIDGLLDVDPTMRQPHTYVLDVDFDAYRTWVFERDAQQPVVDIMFRGGTGSIDLVPIMGEREDRAGVFDIDTPLARIPRATIEAASGFVASRGRRFSVSVDAAELEVASGVYEGSGNFIRGWIVLDGERVELGMDTPLDEDYDQRRFDLSYACAPDLLETVPPN